MYVEKFLLQSQNKFGSLFFGIFFLADFNRKINESCTNKPKGRVEPVQLCKNGLICQKCNYSIDGPKCVKGKG